MKNISRKKIFIAIVSIFILLWILLIIFLVFKESEKERLNPGGTGGGYVPDGFVVLKGIDSSFRLSDGHFVAIRIKLEDFLNKNIPNKNYTVHALKESLDVGVKPNDYQYAIFDIKVNEVYTYKVIFTIDYITNWKQVYIQDGNVSTIENIRCAGVVDVVKKGVPGYILNGLVAGVGSKIPNVKKINISNPKITINSDGSRSLEADFDIDKSKFKLYTDYTTRDQTGSARLVSNKDSKEYRFHIGHYHGD